MPRHLGLALIALLAVGRVAAADESADLTRWQQPMDAVSREDDPAAPFVSFFTPTYSNAEKSTIWSMMAAKWRGTGEIDLAVGIRLVHGDEAPWNIEAASLADGTKLVLEMFPPARTCDSNDACVQREAASVTLPMEALSESHAGDLSITVVTRDGGRHAVTFPRAIVAALSRELGDGEAR